MVLEIGAKLENDAKLLTNAELEKVCVNVMLYSKLFICLVLIEDEN